MLRGAAEPAAAVAFAAWDGAGNGRAGKKRLSAWQALTADAAAEASHGGDAARGARLYAELAGWGSSCDATHLTKPDAAGQQRAIVAALEMAGLSPREVGYCNAHGTATSIGDAIECEALRMAWQDDLDRLAASGIDGALVPLKFARYLLIDGLTGSWGEEVARWLRDQGGPVNLSDAYRHFASHPKARGKRHWQAKVRQQLQRHGQRVGPGRWQRKERQCCLL